MILDFAAPSAIHLSTSGGKGASLARLFQAGFNVPPGVILTASATMPPRESIEEELREKTAALLARGAVAVRSSSTMEDLAGAAFAGQHDTFLGIRTFEQLLDAVRKCYDSLWSERAVAYREARGFDHDHAKMAVVVQSLIGADVAGVAFSMNPITGNLGEVVINASWGLGETVVSGEGDVDQFVLDKKSGVIREQSIGEKTKTIVATEDGATAHLDVDEARRNAPSLDGAQLEELARTISRIERFYGFPQDIEWAFERGTLYILQSRPVTKFPARWTRGESAERFPNVVTPLTWDFVVEGFHASLEHSLKLMGMPPFEGHWFELFDNYVYGNETAVKLFTSGQQVAFDSLDSLRALLPVVRERYQWVVQMPVTWARDLDRYLLSLGALGAADLASMTDDELWRHVAAINRAGSDYFLPNIAISITHGILHRMLYCMVTLLVGPAEGAALYDSLTCFCETKTNLVNNDLGALAAIVRADAKLHELLDRTDRRTLWTEGKLHEFPTFANAFDAFLTNHGHREVDFDTYHPTWVGQPWVVLENIRLLAATEATDPAQREIALRERQQDAERRLNELVPDDLRYFALELVRLARAYTALDDLEHYQTTRLSVPFRRALIELGKRLVQRGVLDEPADVFFMRKQSLPAGLREEAETNKRAWLANRDRTPSWALGEEPENAVAPDGAMRGLPGSPGIAEGPVFRLHGPEDFGKFIAGSVLVARTTNPAWTPLFHSSIAVITESGGPLSHGAVTAREVGIPAVMGVRGALSLFNDGERVRVNGSTGVVTRV